MAGGAALPADVLAVGQHVGVLAAAGSTSGITDANQVLIVGSLNIGTITAVATTAGQPTTFDLLSGGQTLAFSEAGSFAVTPSGTALASGQNAAVYSLGEGSGHVAYAVFESNFPSVQGVVDAASTASGITVDTWAGNLALPYTAQVPVSVGTAAGNDAEIVAGSDVTVSYALANGTATATGISLPASTVSGTISQATTSNGVTALTVATANGNVTVDVLASTNLNGASASALVQGATVSATGVEVGSTLTALSLTVTQTATTISGTIAQVATGNGVTVLTVTTSNGTVTVDVNGSTNLNGASTANLVQGATVSATGVEVGSTLTAQSLTVSQTTATVSGTIAQVTTSNGVIVLTVTTPNGTVTVDVTGSTNLNGASTSALVQGATVSATGPEAGSTVTAQSLTVSQAPTPPPAQTRTIKGTVASATSTSVSLDSHNGPITLALTAGTTYKVGDRIAASGLLAAGQKVTATYTAAAGGSGYTALAIKIMPQGVRGTVAAISSPTSFSLTTAGGRTITVTVAPDATLTGGATLAQGDRVFLRGLDEQPSGFTAYAIHIAGGSGSPSNQGQPTEVQGEITALVGQTLTVTTAGGQAETLTLLPTTTVKVGPLGASVADLAAGEQATVEAQPDGTVSGQTDAVAIDLQPAAVIGTIQSATTSGSTTSLTVSGNLISGGSMLGPGMTGTVRHGGDMMDRFGTTGTFTVLVTSATAVHVFGPGAGSGSGFAAGERIAAVGAAQGNLSLVATTIELQGGMGQPGLPGQPGNGNQGGHGHDRGHRGGGRWGHWGGRHGRRGGDNHAPGRHVNRGKAAKGGKPKPQRRPGQ